MKIMSKRKRLSEKHKQRISEAHKGKKLSAETCKKISASLIGKLRGKQKNGIYSQSLKDRAIQLYKNGYNTVDIKNILKKPHKTTIGDWINDAGIKIIHKDPRWHSKEIRNKALELYKQGYSLKEVANKVKVSAFRTIANWVKCANLSRRCGPRKGRKGSLGNNWRGGISSENQIIRGSEENTNWRLTILESDNFTCVSCGQTGGYLHVHHILMFSKYPQMRFVLENGVTLCKNCHRKLHTKKVNIA